MDDRFPKDDKVDYEVSPESGPGEEAANFRAKPTGQFLGGGGQEESPKPEGERHNSTKASNRFLDLWKKELKPGGYLDALKFVVPVFLVKEIPQDIRDRKYKTAFYKGAAAAVGTATTVVPAVLKITGVI